MRYELVVIGGGASGLMAAVAAASTGAEVCVLERQERVGKPLLATGNGRCNLSNELLDSPEDACLFYNDPDFVLPLLTEYDFTQVVELFGSLGLAVQVDERGLAWPRSNSAVSVLQVLRNRLEHLGVVCKCHTEVSSVDGLTLHCLESSDVPAKGPTNPPAKSLAQASPAQAPQRLEAEALVLACGHSALLSQIKGHDTVPLQPVLGPLTCASPLLKGLEGVRVKAQASLIRAGLALPHKATGELLFKKNGLSGIMIFDLSRSAAVGDIVSIDLFAQLSIEELAHYLEVRTGQLAGYAPERFFDGLLHPRIAAAVLRIAAALLARGTTTGAADVFALPAPRELACILKDLRFEVTGPPKPGEAQLMRGGLVTELFDLYTLESLHTPGLFACGEALNVDGACGGYNLHWAWASGWQAGISAAQRVLAT